MKTLSCSSVDWCCPVCEKSNKEIMRQHEEDINVRAVEKFQAEGRKDKTNSPNASAVDDRPTPSPLDRIQSPEPPSSDEARPGEPILAESDTSAMGAGHQNSLAAPGQTARPPTIMITEDQTETPTPSPLARALLTSPPAYLAPLRIVHYHLCKWFCPIQYLQYLPVRPDSIAWLDTLIFVILSVLTVVVLSKLSRSWSRIAYAIFQAFEKAFGIDMSWITEKFSPTRLPDNPYAQYWASGTAAAMHGDRTRLRNMDTAIRARDVARRFGRPPRAGGARMPVPAHDQPQMDPGATPPVGDVAMPHDIEL